MQTKILSEFTNLLNTSSSFPQQVKSKKSKSLHSQYQTPPSSRFSFNINASSPSKTYISKNFSTTSSIKDLISLKTMARSSTFGGRNFNKSKNDFKIKSEKLFRNLQFTDLSKLKSKTEAIHGVKTDLLLDLYEAKCKDNKTNLIPEQAILFLENFRKTSKRRKFLLGELNLGVESAKILLNLLRGGKNTISVQKQNNNGYIIDQMTSEGSINEEENKYDDDMIDLITHLDLHQNNISDAGINILSSNLSSQVSLISIDISSNSITDAGLEQIVRILTKNKSIISINLSNQLGLNRNKFSLSAFEKFFLFLPNTSSLQFLNLESLYISKEGLKSLELGISNNFSLISLNISNTGLTSQCGKILGGIMINSRLQEIFISENKLSDSGMRKMIEPLKGKIQNLTLQRIHGVGISVSGLGFISFLNTLVESRNLEVIDLSRNCLRGRVFADISYFLLENKSLKELKLNNCDLNWEGGRGIGDGLAKNKYIKKIGINGNNLGNDGAKGLGEGLVDNRSLKWLDVSDCKIGDEGIIALAKGLQHHENLTYLNISENSIHNEGGLYLLETLRNNLKLMEFYFSKTQISYNLTMELKNSIEKNKTLKKRNKLNTFIRRIMRLGNVYEEKRVIDEKIDELNKQKQNLSEIIPDKKKEFECVALKEKEKSKIIECKLTDLCNEFALFEKHNHIFIKNEKKLISETEGEMRKLKELIEEEKLKIYNLEQNIITSREKQKLRKNRYDAKIKELSKINENLEKKCKTSAAGLHLWKAEIKNLSKK